MLNKIEIEDIDINDQLNFNTYTQLDGVLTFAGTVVAKTSYYGLPAGNNAYTHHATIFPIIPESLRQIYSDDEKSYNYIVIKNKIDGKVYYVGEPWIEPATLYSDDIARLTLVIDNFSDSDTTRVRALLRDNGYNVSEIKTENYGVQ